MHKLIGGSDLNSSAPQNQIFNRERVNELRIHFELEAADIEAAVKQYVEDKGHSVSLGVVGLVQTSSTGVVGFIRRIYRAVVNRVEATVIGIAHQ